MGNVGDDALAPDDGGVHEMPAAQHSAEGATPGSTGALDGAAAAGSAGAVSSRKSESLMPTEAPDPSVGPD